MTQHRAFGHGFSLIELMIAIVISSFLILLAAPIVTASSSAIRSIRNAAEAVLNGVRLAQTQAIKVNTSAAFVLDPATMPDRACAGSRRCVRPRMIENLTCFNAKARRRRRSRPIRARRPVTFARPRAPACSITDAAAQLTQIDITNANVPTPQSVACRHQHNLPAPTASSQCDPALCLDRPGRMPMMILTRSKNAQAGGFAGSPDRRPDLLVRDSGHRRIAGAIAATHRRLEIPRGSYLSGQSADFWKMWTDDPAVLKAKYDSTVGGAGT